MKFIRFYGNRNLGLTCFALNMHQIKKNFKYMLKYVQNELLYLYRRKIFPKNVKGPFDLKIPGNDLKRPPKKKLLKSLILLVCLLTIY